MTRYDTSKLTNKVIRDSFVLECSNRFALLEDGGAGDVDGSELTADGGWSKVKDVYRNVAQSVLGQRKRKRKIWITDGK